MSIPKILHQTWKTQDVPREWQAFADSWRRLHPSWEYKLWTDADNRAFVARHYPELLKAYDGFSYAIQRADAVRYCLLHHFGGVYADLDIECLLPVDDLIERAAFIGVFEPPQQSAWVGTYSLVSNAFMASVPGHALLGRVIQTLAETSSPGLTHRDVLELTGPLMLNRVLHDYGGTDTAILESQTAFPFLASAPEMQTLLAGGNEGELLRRSLAGKGTFAVHYWSNSWVDALAGELVNPEPFGIEGYDFFQGLDSPGWDIANVGRDVRRAAIACDALPASVGFNTDGFIKARLLPREDWIEIRRPAFNTGLYVKRTSRPGMLARVARLAGAGLRRFKGDWQ